MNVPNLAIVIPTFNELKNVTSLVESLHTALNEISWEVIFVDDDSPDGTSKILKTLAASDARIRCLRRVGRRGLAGACIEGMLATAAPVVAVMDADFQHDEFLLPQMLAALEAGADLVVGTRYAEGAEARRGFSVLRLLGSTLAVSAAQRLLKVQLTDPMSGFFMICRNIIEEIAPRLSTQGFKILLDIISSCPKPLKTVELAYYFRARQHGASKLDAQIALEYLGLLLAKLSNDWVSTRFILFAMVGATGVVVHLVLLGAILSIPSLTFEWKQSIASLGAMTWNFILNNRITYRDRRLTGVKAIWGLFSFYVVCSIGLLANVSVASWVYSGEPNWWLAGALGALMSAVFNYFVLSTWTWRSR